MNVGSLFSGIGGIDLGLERAGMRVVWQCEQDAWCRGILARHWPGVPCYDDVRSIVADPESYGRGQGWARRPDPSGSGEHELALPVRLPVPRVDVLAGGFPCQPVSLAGKGLAQADERWLWPEFARLIRVLRPRYVIAENVPGLLTRGLDIVLADLAALRFDAEWTVFGARDVGAPHKRDRVWIVAWDTNPDLDRREGLAESHERPAGGLEASLGHDPDGRRLALPDSQREQLRHEPRRSSRRSRPDQAIAGDDGAQGTLAHAEGERWEPRLRPLHALRPGEQPAVEPQGRPRLRRAPAHRSSDSWAVEPDVGRVAHGIPQRVDRLRALGNAVVPACAEHIGRLVMNHARAHPAPLINQENA